MELAIIGALISGAGTILGAVSQSSAMKAQGEADVARARIEAEWAERRALEEKSAGQRNANAAMRRGDLAQSRLVARAAASGSGVSDPTVANLYGGIEQEARYSAGMETAAAGQKAAGLQYQADLGVWGANANQNIKEHAADGILVSGILSGMGSMIGGVGKAGGMPSQGAYGSSPMAERYSDPTSLSNPEYFYGGHYG